MRSDEIQDEAAGSAGSTPAANLLVRTPTKDELDQLEHDFGYKAPTPDQVPLYAKINEAARNMVLVLLESCPPSADRSAAIRKVREARMTANASIALDRRTK